MLKRRIISVSNYLEIIEKFIFIHCEQIKVNIGKQVSSQFSILNPEYYSNFRSIQLSYELITKFVNLLKISLKVGLMKAVFFETRFFCSEDFTFLNTFSKKKVQIPLFRIQFKVQNVGILRIYISLNTPFSVKCVDMLANTSTVLFDGQIQLKEREN